MKLKYISTIALTAILLALSVTSCKKFTELQPLDKLSDKTAFTSKQNIDLALNGVYWQAAVGRYDPGTGLTTGRGYPFGGASIEQGEMRGEDMINLQAFYQITYEGTYTPTTANNVNHWEQLYALINQANVFIKGVEGAVASGVLTQEESDIYKGEVLFLRALAHHELVLHFCKPYADNKGANQGVPYRTKAMMGTTDVEEGLSEKRGTVAEDYAKIIEDLNNAESFLPATKSNKSLSISKATKGAAIALKTRIYLHMGDYQNVIAEGNKLGTDASNGEFSSLIGGYKLELDAETPFTSQENNSESIFSIAQTQAQNGGVNGAIASMFSASSLRGRDLIGTSPNLYNASFWVEGDVRKTKLQLVQKSGSYQMVFNYKYRAVAVLDSWNPIIRYSEVLLNVAEAHAYNGNNAQAFSLLNAVRNRSVPADKKFATAPADLKLAIYQERRIEFAGEGKRWADIHRLVLSSYGYNGVPSKVQATQVTTGGLDNYKPGLIIEPKFPGIPYQEKSFLWPLPQSEMSSNPNLEQNPGYGK
ncbi:RagB/SusD family nutrient uptake outer membrane protein [Sphingobacterium sp. SG20118]|uniref:RagB/SusD family nutrient uptake outer membrane protein n=1 Tax=Sphingobacterium sp. SG20118 TaxID=3367156 RepID=UPI0037DFC18C